MKFSIEVRIFMVEQKVKMKMIELKYIGSERIKLCKRIQSVLEKEGILASLDEAYALWCLYSKDTACIDWVYPDDEITDEKLFKMIEEYMVRV